MNILFITNTYGDYASANGQCCKVLVEELEKKNKVFVISTKYENCTKSFEALSNNVELYRVWRGLQTLLKTKYHCFFLSKVVYKIKGIWNKNKYPLEDQSLVRRYVKAFCKINKNHKIDVVVSTYARIEDCLAGEIIKKRNPEIKFIVYTLDALTGRDSDQNETKLQSINKYEKRIYRNADTICCLESHRSWYEKNSDEYAEFFSKINYVELPLFVNRKNEYKKDVTQDKTFVYTGLFNRKVDISDFYCSMLQSNPRVQFKTYGVYSSQYEKCKKYTNFSYCGWVGKAEIVSAQNNADFLLSIGNMNACDIPSKVFEYMSAGRPILHLFMSDTDPALPYVAQYKSGISIDLRVDESINLQYIKKFLDENYPTLDLEEYEMKFYRLSPKEMCKIICL